MIQTYQFLYLLKPSAVPKPANNIPFNNRQVFPCVLALYIQSIIASVSDGLLKVLPVALAQRVHVSEVFGHDFVGGPPARVDVPFGCA